MSLFLDFVGDYLQLLEILSWALYYLLLSYITDFSFVVDISIFKLFIVGTSIHVKLVCIRFVILRYLGKQSVSLFPLRMVYMCQVEVGVVVLLLSVFGLFFVFFYLFFFFGFFIFSAFLFFFFSVVSFA